MVAITALGLAYRGPRNLQAFPRRRRRDPEPADASPLAAL